MRSGVPQRTVMQYGVGRVVNANAFLGGRVARGRIDAVL